MMRDTQLVLVMVGFTAAVVVLLLVVSSRRTAAIREMVRALTTSAGWIDLRNVFMAAAGVKGSWRSFPVDLSYHARQKGVPQRLVLRVRASTDARLIFKRRFNGFFSNRPLTWFGPPIVETHAPGASEFWVRGDDVMLIERLFADAAAALSISSNLVARFDEIRINRSGLRITRALDDRLVRAKYGMPSFAVRFEVKRIEPIAQEELALGERLVDVLLGSSNRPASLRS